MIKVYKVDKVACLKHIAAEEGTMLSYRSKTEEARRQAALKKQKQRKACIPDKSAQFGPPDRASNYLPMTATSRKRKSSQSTGTEIVYPREEQYQIIHQTVTLRC